ncbi:MAG TPA: HypC/HybG/HupF family hydrogenase formation chaperone [Spirillospora sp.]|nr:HypC/HybG/HupF family hydrogenase formation chaperone [Spirillospora sp.]
MCLEQMGRVVETGDGIATTAVGRRRLPLSLVILESQGVPVSPGDWLIAHCGIALRKITEHEAAELLAARADAVEPLS